MTFLAFAFLVAVALLAWTWAGVCIRKERAKEAREYGELFGPVCDIREQLLRSDEYGRLFE